ncbi:hypothetical protein V6N12_051998 [Hibiscus sabdariffa]|uniref:beta-galactosidase n=1 Tax=Hibiscus sabdariffa TaxID=183260 RepID=A0ABR2GGY2_9ROSI
MANVEPNFLKIVSETEVVEAMLQFNRWEFDAFIRPYMSPGHITSLSEVGGCCHIVALDANTDRVFSVKLVRHSDYYLLMGSGVSAMIRQNIFVVGYEQRPKEAWMLYRLSPGNYYFEDRYDLVRFVKLVQQSDLYVHLRIGPYICAEWNFGGFPVWLKYVPGIVFGTDPGKAYTKWAVGCANGSRTRHSRTPNAKYKPKMWTENWTGCLDLFEFLSPQYHGGTNFGRTSGGPFIATSYDYDAPIDEYRQLREPKWGHLRDLHRAIKLCEPALVSADPTVTSLGSNQELGAKSSEKQIVPVTAAFSWQSYDEERPSTDDQNVGFGNRSLSVGVNIDPSEEFLKSGQDPLLTIWSAGHALHVFINGQLSV